MTVKDRIVRIFISVVILLIGAPAFASDELDGARAAKLGYLEMVAIGRCFPAESVQSRLARLERVIRGKAETGDAAARIGSLMTQIGDSPPMKLKGGIAKSNLDRDDSADSEDADGKHKGAAATFSQYGRLRPLRITFSLGGSQISDSFNGRDEIDSLADRFVEYLRSLISAAAESQPGQQQAVGRLHVNMHLALKGNPQYFDRGAVRGVPLTRSSLNAASSTTGGNLSPLIIEVSLGGSDIRSSFNGSNLEDGSRALVPHPYALSVRAGVSHAADSFNGSVPEFLTAGGESFQASDDFQSAVAKNSAQGARAVIISFHMGGSRITNSFNGTGGIVRLAQRIADRLKDSLSAEAVANLSVVHAHAGGGKIENVVSR